MTDSIVLVTGANQGLGYSIIEVGAVRQPQTTWILASRDLKNGEEAVGKLRSEVGHHVAIDLMRLDVTDDDQIQKAVQYVETKYGRLDVLVNNAGKLVKPADDSLSALRRAYDDCNSINLTSVAIMTEAFIPLLHKSAAPKVINITSGLGSIQNALTKKMGRYPPYGAAKIGMNGLSAHQQTAEKDRIEAEEKGERARSDQSFIKWYIVTPGVLKTAFSNFSARGRDPREGAEPVIRLAFDQGGEYAYATNWEWQDGQMKVVPW